MDIIARKGDLAIFVEVKARKTEQMALDAVGYTAQARIRSASDLWISRHPQGHLLSQRYDVVAVLPCACLAIFLMYFEFCNLCSLGRSCNGYVVDL